MRLLFEASPQELSEKRDDFVKALADQFRMMDPELSEVLEKALPHKEPSLKYRAMEQLRKQTAEEYRKTLDRMVEDIGTVLDQGVQKSEVRPLRKAAKKLTKGQAAYTKVEGSLYACNECKHWAPGTPAGEQPNHCVAHKSGQGAFAPNGRCEVWTKGEPVPGRKPEGTLTKKLSLYRENEYHTGFRCNRCRFWVEGGQCERVAGDIELTATCKLWEVIYDVPVPLTKADVGLVGEEGGEDADPDYDDEGNPIFDPETGLSPSELAEDKEKNPEAYEDEEEDVEKSGPYVGPRGGKWADPQHTIPWKEKKAPKVSISEQQTGYHHGQSDIRMVAKVGGKVAGKLDYSIYQGTPHINMVEVVQKRKGVGSKLVGKLADQYGYENIEWGMMTESGYALREALDKKYGYDREAAETPFDLGGLLETHGAKTLSGPGPGNSMDTIGAYVEVQGKAKADALTAEIEKLGGTVNVEDSGDTFWLDIDVPEFQKSEAVIEHVNDVFDRETVAYNRVKTVLQRKGYKPEDFEEGGVLYGYSVNELIEMAKPKFD